MAVFWVVGRMEAARTSEMLVNFYQTTQCYNPEDSHLRTHHRENLKSYFERNLNHIIYRQTNALPSIDMCMVY
jgi:hypothetical protein